MARKSNRRRASEEFGLAFMGGMAAFTLAALAIYVNVTDPYKGKVTRWIPSASKPVTLWYDGQEYEIVHGPCNDWLCTLEKAHNLKKGTM